MSPTTRPVSPLLPFLTVLILIISLFAQYSLADTNSNSKPKPSTSTSTSTSSTSLPNSTPPPTQPADQHLNVTALTGHHGSTVFECWQLNVPLAPTNRSGISGALLSNLGNVSSLLYQVIPANYAGSLHNAPDVRFVQVISGLAVLSLPDSPGVFHYQTPGPAGLLLAADTPDVSAKGHLTAFPGAEVTVSLSMPVAGGKVPEHRVLHAGPCVGADFVGI